MSEPILPLLRAYAAERRRTLTEHPTPDELLDYHLGDGAPEQRELIQDHLALCPDCARALLDFAAFPDLVPAAGGDPPPAAAAAWTRLRERTFAAAPAVAVRQPRAPRRRVKALSLIAASLLMASLAGLGGYHMGNLGSTPEGQVFAPVLKVEEVERSVGAPEEILVPDWAADGFVLSLQPEDPEEFSRFEVAILPFRGKGWRQTDLRKDPSGQVSFYVPRDILSGPSVVELYGVGEGEPTLIMQKRIDLQWPDRQD